MGNHNKLKDFGELKEMYEEYRTLFFKIETGEKIIKRCEENRINFENVHCKAWIDSDGGFEFEVPINNLIDYMKSDIERSKQRMDELGKFLDRIKEIGK